MDSEEKVTFLFFGGLVMATLILAVSLGVDSFYKVRVMDKMIELEKQRMSQEAGKG